MKIKEGFILREIGGELVVIATGDLSRDFNGTIILNKSGRFLWEMLQKGCDADDMVNALLNKYDIDEAKARIDTITFINKIDGANLFE